MFVGYPGGSIVCMLHICTHSGGCGRTGTFIAVSILLERLKTEGVVDVFNTVRSLRLQRPSMVQSVVRHHLVNYCPNYRGSHCILYVHNHLCTHPHCHCRTSMSFATRVFWSSWTHLSCTLISSRLYHFLIT